MSIPIRNIWWLMLYASDLGEAQNKALKGREDLPEDIPDLIGQILIKTVEKRLKRQLTYSFETKDEILSRVRGRINHLTTCRKQLLSKGKVSCTFNELSIDNVRNRYVRAALDGISRIIKKPSISNSCSSLANNLFQCGVTGPVPTAREIENQRFSRNDQSDKEMIAAAKLAMNLCLPNESEGKNEILDPEKSEHWMRRLYEKAIGNFYRFHLNPDNWTVITGKPMNWMIYNPTDGIKDILPSMKTDIILDNKIKYHRIVIDTKFTNIFHKRSSWYREKSLKSGYIYQLYAYLRTQEGLGEKLNEDSSGMLLHPAIGEDIDESVTIQGHEMRFSTVDLTQPHEVIRNRLLNLVS